MKSLSLFVLLIFLLQACSKRPDLEAETKAILAIHSEQRKAHMEKDVLLLLGDSTVEYVEVNRGLVKKPTYAENLKRFTSYFETVDFIKWDDVSPPIISFSEDATMATSVVDKLVITQSKSETNKFDTTQFAWLVVFKKSNGKWQLHRMGSTNK